VCVSHASLLYPARIVPIIIHHTTTPFVKRVK
jgi:hypothetical protein